VVYPCEASLVMIMRYMVPKRMERFIFTYRNRCACIRERLFPFGAAFEPYVPSQSVRAGKRQGHGTGRVRAGKRSAKNSEGKSKPAGNEETLQHAKELSELGTFYFLNQRFDEAIAQFQAAAELEPSNPKNYYDLGIVYESINRIAEAKEMFAKALALDSCFQSAKEHLDRLVGM
jgi:tetratricopeptide (TPR) repeat protein